MLTGEKDCDSSDRTASDVAVDDGFLALLNSALPLSNIRAMVAEQHRQDQEELAKVKKSLDSEFRTDGVSCKMHKKQSLLLYITDNDPKSSKERIPLYMGSCYYHLLVHSVWLQATCVFAI